MMMPTQFLIVVQQLSSGTEKNCAADINRSNILKGGFMRACEWCGNMFIILISVQMYVFSYMYFV